MKIIQSSSFARKVKKLHKQDKKELDNLIRKIIKSPLIGEEKRGDLKGILIYKFKLQNTKYLLAYRKKSDCIELIMIGPHENYYKNLKTYIKHRSQT